MQLKKFISSKYSIITCRSENSLCSRNPLRTWHKENLLKQKETRWTLARNFSINEPETLERRSLGSTTGRFEGRDTFSRHPVCSRTIRSRGETSGMHTENRDGRTNGKGGAAGRKVREGGTSAARAERKWSYDSLPPPLLPLSLSTTVSTTSLCLSNARTLQEKRNIDQDGDIKVERRCTMRITCATFSS